MIRYALRCRKGHEFEAWFKSGAAFDEQSDAGKVTCAVCGSKRVEKALMAPSVATRERKSVAVAQTPSDEKAAAIQREMVTLMRKLRHEVERNADYVGPNFAEEARKIHYEEAPARGIYGEASAEDARALQDEGIDFYPLPPLPEDKN